MNRLRIPPIVDTDVVVAGGGPAGASAAARLATAGLRVVVLDRRRFPRDKVCGDFVGPAALVELEALGITDCDGYRRTQIIRQAALHLDGIPLIRRRLPQREGVPPYGRCIPRLTLDAWVLDAARRAGAVVQEGVSFSGYEVEPDAVRIFAQRGREAITLRARLLVGADGSSSAVARTLRGAPPRDADRIIAVRAYYKGDIGPHDRCDLYFTAQSFPGYYWLFPTGGGRANVGVGMVLETVPPAEERLRDLLLRLVQRDEALRARLADARIEGKVVGWPLSTYDPSAPIVGNRVILVGDAAGFINPLNGEGIQYALASGRWAAEAALEAHAAGDWSAARLQAYADRAEHGLRYDMALAAMIVQFIRNRHLNPIWLEALRVITARARADEDYAEITGGILAGLEPASAALSPKVLGRTVDQAVSSLLLDLGFNALKGPRHLRRRGAEAVRAGAVMAADMLSDPVTFLAWMVGLAKHAGELAAQVGAHILEDRESEREPSPCSIAAPARLRIPITAPTPESVTTIRALALRRSAGG